ncbi:MAG: DUF3592 domain-containing protein [Bdellovibrionota bacterium]
MPEEEDDAEENKDPRVLLGMGIVFLLIGCGVLAYGLSELRDALATRDWPTVHGTITQSQMGAHHSRDSDSPSTTYFADLVYVYDAGGRSYSGKRLCWMEWRSNDYGHWEEIVNRYPVGRAVNIHYDPANPENAVLEPGPVLLNYLPLLLGAAFLIGGIALIRQWRKLPPVQRRP